MPEAFLHECESRHRFCTLLHDSIAVLFSRGFVQDEINNQLWQLTEKPVQRHFDLIFQNLTSTKSDWI